MEMEVPKAINNIQKLNGQITAFGKFITCLAKKQLPFFKALKGKKNSYWENYEKALFEIETFLSFPFLLNSLKLVEVLYLYLVVT